MRHDPILPGPGHAYAEAGGEGALEDEAPDRQVLQCEAGHVEDRDVVRRSLETHGAGHDVAEFDCWHHRCPLQLADPRRLGLIVDDEAAVGEKPFG